MATPEVPGYLPQNQDTLAAGCWGEHKDDSSLILVEEVENERVIYTIFDIDNKKEFRDQMPIDLFMRSYSYVSGESVASLQWVWHDKTIFPWRKVIDNDALIERKETAAVKVAENLNLEGKELVKDPKRFSSIRKLVNKLQEAISRLRA